MSKENIRVGEAFLIGGAIGALAGLLLAPKPGHELRSDIRRKAQELSEEGAEL